MNNQISLQIDGINDMNNSTLSIHLPEFSGYEKLPSYGRLFQNGNLVGAGSVQLTTDMNFKIHVTDVHKRIYNRPFKLELYYSDIDIQDDSLATVTIIGYVCKNRKFCGLVKKFGKF